MSRITSLSEWLLRQAAVWGSLAYLAFFALIVRSAPAESWLARYFDGHFIKYATGVLFFIGLAALLIRSLRLALEHASLERIRIPSPPADGQSAADAGALLADLEATSGQLSDSYLVRRLRESLQYVRQKGDADTLESHMRHLEEVDLGRMSQGYGAVRIIVSIIPILGFLGTVLGITLAIARLDADSMETALPAVIDGLSVAFDTTGLSLSLSMVLLGVKFLVERFEYRLLSRVDESAAAGLLGRFRQYGSQNDPRVAAVHRMCEQTLQAVVQTVQQAVEQSAATQAQSLESQLLSLEAQNHALEVQAQSFEARAESLQNQLGSSHNQVTETLASASAQLGELLSQINIQVVGSVDQAMTAWSEMASQVGETLEGSISAGLTSGLEQHAAALNQGVSRHSDDLRGMLVRHAEILSEGCDQFAQRLVEVLEHHTAIVTETETQLADENRRHLSDVEAALGEAMLVSATRQEKAINQSEELLKEMQIALVEGAGNTVAQHEQLVKQGEVLLRVVEATGQVKHLEDALNKNLASLSATRHFEETLVNLSATLQLLSARLGEPGRQTPKINLSGEPPRSHAA